MANWNPYEVEIPTAGGLRSDYLYFIAMNKRQVKSYLDIEPKTPFVKIGRPYLPKGGAKTVEWINLFEWQKEHQTQLRWWGDAQEKMCRIVTAALPDGWTLRPENVHRNFDSSKYTDISTWQGYAYNEQKNSEELHCYDTMAEIVKIGKVSLVQEFKKSGFGYTEITI